MGWGTWTGLAQLKGEVARSGEDGNEHWGYIKYGVFS